MPRISVMTAVHPDRTDFLVEAYESVRAQVLPDGWSLEWLVQQDGVGNEVFDALPNDAIISGGSNRRGGAAVARTMALSRARGSLIRVLDADDILPAGALARDINVLTNHADVFWTTSRVQDLLPDGSTVQFSEDPEPGPIRRGELYDYWTTHDFRVFVHPATLCIDTQTLLMLGGWMALPASEDTGLLLALNAVATGYFISEPGLHYRKWAGQSTADEAHLDPIERNARMTVVGARTRALRQDGGPIIDAVLSRSNRC